LGQLAIAAALPDDPACDPLAFPFGRSVEDPPMPRLAPLLAWSLCLCAALSCSAARAAETAAPLETGEYEQLFNGKDLSGWDGDPRLWSVREGVIHGETTAGNPAMGNTFLIWQGGRLKDFELRLSFRCTNTNNSGIQYRSRHITDGEPKNPWVVRGYQHEIRNENKLPSVSGFIYDEGGKRGRICLVGEKATWDAESGKKVDPAPLIDAAEFEKLMRLDDWNDVVIIARGDNIQHYLNGRLILDFTDAPELALREGILAVQLHAGKPMWAEYRNIRLKPLN
jgi:hypothetical protein